LVTELQWAYSGIRFGAMEFHNWWGETTCDLPLSIPQVLDHNILHAREPPHVDFPHHEFTDHR
jgi:omega-hydroxypalmitate O-feruloyl transferase